MQLGELIDKLCDSEINCAISAEWEAGMLVQLGDAINGFIAETYVRTSAEAAAWLDTQVRRRYPKSPYACGEGHSISENVN